MIISQLIKELENVLAEQGDIKCVTPGFDEGGIDEVTTVDIIYITEVAGGWYAQYEDVSEESEQSEPACLINF